MRRLLAEFLGALLLAAAVIGSGIMAQDLAQGNDAIALLANTAATVATLAVLIGTLGPVSGAHFNPAVTFAALLRREMASAQGAGYILVQVLGCCAGALLAHAMFDLPLLQSSVHVRSGAGQWLSEFVATAGLVWVVASCKKPGDGAWRVPLWIGAAYWFTASTSFANPAITIARSLTDSFSGIRPVDVPAFLLAQFVGAAAGLLVAQALTGRRPAPGPMPESAPQAGAGSPAP
jgi:glycerol uptake facilitator-like aquaporin